MVSAGAPPLVWTHYPLVDVPAGHVNIHGHAHGAPPGRSAHINVAVEQLDYEPVGLGRLRRLARALAAGHYPPGATTLERIAHLEQERGAGDTRTGYNATECGVAVFQVRERAAPVAGHGHYAFTSEDACIAGRFIVFRAR